MPRAGTQRFQAQFVHEFVGRAEFLHDVETLLEDSLHIAAAQGAYSVLGGGTGDDPLLDGREQIAGAFPRRARTRSVGKVLQPALVVPADPVLHGARAGTQVRRNLLGGEPPLGQDHRTHAVPNSPVGLGLGGLLQHLDRVMRFHVHPCASLLDHKEYCPQNTIAQPNKSATARKDFVESV